MNYVILGASRVWLHSHF